MQASRCRAEVLSFLLSAAAVLGLRTGVHSPDVGRQGPEDECRGRPYAEPGRPQFHFTPERNWMNDPNGLVYYGGEYHLFFQYNPYGVNHGNMSWGHAVSTDLMHWKQLDTAIPQDEQGDIWSGSAVVDWKNTSGLQLAAGEPPLVALYTNHPRSFQPHSQRLAFSTNRGRSWQRLRHPVIAADDSMRTARDPKVIWHEASSNWLMALFARNHGSEDLFHLYTSGNLRNWTKIQELSLKGAGGECPDIFELPLIGGPPGSKGFVFMAASGAYVVGTFDGKAFTPWGRTRYLEYGDAYAGQTYSDEPLGRRVQISWMGLPHSRTCQGRSTFAAEPFTGQMTVPVELELVQGPDGPRLRRHPVSELRSLQHGPTKKMPAELSSSGAGLQVRLRARLAPGAAASRLAVRLLGQDVEVVMFRASMTRRFRPGAWQLVEDVPSSAFAGTSGRELPLQKDASGAVELTILADRHSLEVFDEWGGASMATCFSLPCKTALRKQAPTITADNSTVVIERLEIIELKSALPLTA